MAVSLSEAISKLNRPGDALLIRNLVPNTGMANALATMNRAGADRGYDIVGGKGSPYGGLETRVSTKSASNQVYGDFKTAVRNYIRDPFEFKRKLQEEKELSKEALKNNITKTEANLLWGNARGLFSRATNAQTSILFGIFEVLRLQARYTIAQAKVWGVKSTDLRQPYEDPTKGPLARIFGAVFSDIKRLPGMEFLTSLTKHTLNIAKFLNPFTMGTRAMNLKPGEWIQKMLMGKEGYELAKNPELAKEKAGLKLTDQQRSTNLLRATANYLKESLNVQTNMLRGIQELVRLMGSELKIQRIDLGHDEYSGELKSGRELEQDRVKREAALSSVHQKAARKSLAGKISPVVSFFRGEMGWQQKLRAQNSEMLTKYDVQLMTDLVQSNRFFDYLQALAKADPQNLLVISFQDLMKKTNGRLDFSNKKNIIELQRFKKALYLEYRYASTHATPNSLEEQFARAFELAQDTAQSGIDSQNIYQHTRNLANRAGSNLGGGRRILSTRQINQQANYLDRFNGNAQLAHVYAGGALEATLNDKFGRFGKIFERMIPILGIRKGLEQGIESSGIWDKIRNFMGISGNREGTTTATNEALGPGTNLPAIIADNNRNNTTNIIQQPSISGVKPITFSNQIADAIGATLMYYLYGVPIGTQAVKPIGQLSIAGAIGLLAVSTGDVNGKSTTWKELEKLREAEERQKALEEHQHRVERLLDMVANNTDDSRPDRYTDIVEREEARNKNKGGPFGTIGDMLSTIFATGKGARVGVAALLAGGMMTDTGRAITGFVWDNVLKPTLVGISTLLLEKLPEWGSSLLGMAAGFTADHPMIGIGLFGTLAATLIPGPIGKAVKGVLKYTVSHPIKSLGLLAIGYIIKDFLGKEDTNVGDFLFDFGLLGATMFPGFVGDMLKKVGPMLMKHPLVGFGTLAVAGIVHSFFSARKAAGNDGIMSTKFWTTFLAGGEGGFTNALGMAGKYAMIGATVGSVYPGIGTIAGMVAGGVFGAFMGWIGSDGLGKIGSMFSNLWNVITGKKQAQITKSAEQMADERISEAFAKQHNLKEVDGVLMSEQEAAEHNKIKDEKKKKANLEALRKKRQEEIAKERSKIDVTWDSSGMAIGASYNGVGGPPEMDEPNSSANKAISEAKNQQTDDKSSPSNNLPENTSFSKLEQAATESSGSSGSKLNQIEQMIADVINGELGFGSVAMSGISSFFGGGQSSSGIPSGIDIDDITSTSAHFESGGKTEIVAYDSGGGTSYGKHQLASKSSMIDFLNWVKTQGPNGQKIYETMYQSVGGDWGKLNTGSKFGPPVEAWKKLVADGTVGNLDRDFFANVWFPRTLKSIDPPGLRKLVEENKPLQHALFSGMVQHGEAGVKKLFRDAYRPGMSAEEFAEAFYNLRAERKYGENLPANIQQSLRNRYMNEKAIILSMLNPQKYGSSVAGDGTSLVWPAQSNVITSPFGRRTNVPKGGSLDHDGIDIRGAIGDPVMAALPGVVEKVKMSPWGNVEIRHSNGLKTRYLHMSESLVEKGEQVKSGQQIGKVGDRKDPKQIPGKMHPHLHFGIENQQGQPIDPELVYYQYAQQGGKTAYDSHEYAPGVDDSKKLPAKLAQGGTPPSVLSLQVAQQSQGNSPINRMPKLGRGSPLGVGGDDEDDRLSDAELEKKYNNFYVMNEDGLEDRLTGHRVAHYRKPHELHALGLETGRNMSAIDFEIAKLRKGGPANNAKIKELEANRRAFQYEYDAAYDKWESERDSHFNEYKRNFHRPASEIRKYLKEKKEKDLKERKLLDQSDKILDLMRENPPMMLKPDDIDNMSWSQQSQLIRKFGEQYLNGQVPGQAAAKVEEVKQEQAAPPSPQGKSMEDILAMDGQPGQAAAKVTEAKKEQAASPSPQGKSIEDLLPQTPDKVEETKKKKKKPGPNDPSPIPGMTMKDYETYLKNNKSRKEIFGEGGVRKVLDARQEIDGIMQKGKFIDAAEGSTAAQYNQMKEEFLSKDNPITVRLNELKKKKNLTDEEFKELKSGVTTQMGQFNKLQELKVKAIKEAEKRGLDPKSAEKVAEEAVQNPGKSVAKIAEETKKEQDPQQAQTSTPQEGVGAATKAEEAKQEEKLGFFGSLKKKATDWFAKNREEAKKQEIESMPGLTHEEREKLKEANGFKEQVDQTKQEEKKVEQEENQQKEEKSPLMKEMKRGNAIAAASAQQQASSPPPVAVSSDSKSEGAVTTETGGTVAEGDPEVDGLVTRLFQLIGTTLSSLNIGHTSLAVPSV